MTHVTRLSIAPVRALGLEHPSEIELTELGVAEDRRFYLIDEQGRLIDRHVVPGLVRIASHTDPTGCHLRLTFPNGEVIEGDVQLGEPIETPIYGRLGVGHLVIGPWAHPLSHFAGRPIRIVRTDRIGGTRTKHPATLVSDGSLARLGEALGVRDVDGRRFRMLIELGDGGAHEEDGWIGGRIAVGETVLQISGAVPRCAYTTQNPETGDRDLDTLRAIKAYRGLVDGHDLMFGVFGEVERPGRVRLGDAVCVLG